jgi:hypothetical protein
MTSTTSIDVRYDVELVPQQTGMSCWAASAAMVVGWRDRVCIDPGEVAGAAGYWAQYRDGLEPEDATIFAVWGLEPEPAMCWSVDGFLGLLESFGPLWIAAAVPGAHVRVVTAMAGDGSVDGTLVTINDPWETGMTEFALPNDGSTYTLTYGQLMEQMDSLGARELSIPGAIYVAHSTAAAAAAATGTP